MRLLHALRELLQTWQGAVLSILAVVGAIYYGPRKMLETWDWYLDRFKDQPIIDAMLELRMPPRVMPDPRGPQYASPAIVSIIQEGSYSVGDLAKILNRSHQSIGKSIRRLKKKGKIEQQGGGFKVNKHP
jgi:hypothetical protein